MRREGITLYLLDMSTSLHTHNKNRILAPQELDGIINYCTDAVTDNAVSTAGRKTFGGIDPSLVIAHQIMLNKPVLVY